MAIWTAPPGPAELGALAQVKPQRTYLFALDPGADRPNAFLRRLAGLVKHSLNVRDGRASVSALAVATGQREGTVRLGLAWLAARGSIRIVNEAGDVVQLMLGDGHPEAELKMLAASLEAALEETAAYRTYFREAVASRDATGQPR